MVDMLIVWNVTFSRWDWDADKFQTGHINSKNGIISYSWSCIQRGEGFDDVICDLVTNLPKLTEVCCFSKREMFNVVDGVESKPVCSKL